MPRWGCLLYGTAHSDFVRETTQRFDPRHERFALCKRFRATAVREVECLPVLNQIFQKNTGERRLSETGIPANANNATVALLCSIVSLAQDGAVGFPAHNVTHRGAGCLGHIACRRLVFASAHRGNEPVTGLRNGLDISVVARPLIE